MMNIVFVCTGNTCRSPMAEGIFNSFINKGYFANSAGIFANPQDKPSENSIIAMKKLGIDIKVHRARQLDEELINCAHLILTMSQSHKNAILNANPELSNKVFTLAEFSGINKDISDPFGQSVEVYEKCAKEIFNLVKKAYDKL